MKQEDFLKDVSLISDLKLRGGYGITGNQSSVTDPYTGSARYREILSGQTQTQERTDTNLYLKWETSNTFNVGVDMAFLSNKLTATVDYYIRKTNNMIVSPSMVAGATKPVENTGAMTNKGLEVSLGYRNMDNDFKYEVSGNVSFLGRPMVNKLADNSAIKRGVLGKHSGMIWTQAGHELDSYMGYKTDGLIKPSDLDPSSPTYNPVYANNQFHVGDPKIVFDDTVVSDKGLVKLGSPNPDLTYGFNITLMWKGFDVKCFFQGVHGNKLMNSLYAFINAPTEGRYNLMTNVLNGYQAKAINFGDGIVIPANTSTSQFTLVDGNSIMDTYFTDIYVEDGSYLRWKNFQIGYTLPKSLLSKIKLENLRIYFSIDNVKTWTKYSGYDPEVGRNQSSAGVQSVDNNGDPLAAGIDEANYPSSRKYTLGLSLSF